MFTELSTLPHPTLSREKIELIKQTVARGATDLELQLFFHACERTGLDPLMKQIYAIKRWDAKLGKEAMAIQTGIDGYRIIAERTGRYAPGPRTIFSYNDKNELVSAVASVKKQTADGSWHIVEHEAFWDEYVQKTKDGSVTSMWQQKGHIMLGKCAESGCLRKAFPAELAGVYTHEEMMQADNEPKTVQSQDNGPTEVPPPRLPLQGSGDTGAAPIHSVASSKESACQGQEIGEPAVRDAATSRGGQSYANSQVGELTPEGQGQVKSTVRTQQPTNPPAAFIWQTGKIPQAGGHFGESIRTIDAEYLIWYSQNGKRADHIEEANLELDYRRSLNNG